MTNAQNVPPYSDFPAVFPLLLRHALIGGGIECDDGWRKLLHDLFTQLEQHVEQAIRLNQFETNARPIPAAEDGGEHGRLAWLHQDKQWILVPYTIQVKQKFASLRVYVQGATDSMRELIDAAEARAAKTCEVCGAKGTARQLGRFHTVRCDEHSTLRRPE